MYLYEEVRYQSPLERNTVSNIPGVFCVATIIAAFPWLRAEFSYCTLFLLLLMIDSHPQLHSISSTPSSFSPSSSLLLILFSSLLDLSIPLAHLVFHSFTHLPLSLSTLLSRPHGPLIIADPSHRAAYMFLFRSK